MPAQSIEPPDGHRREDVVRLDSCELGQPAGVAGRAGAGAEGGRAHRGGVTQHGGDRTRGVRVVEDPGSRRDLGQVSADRLDHGQVAERAQHPARPDGVRDVHEDPVAARDLDVVLPGGHAAYGDRDDHEVGSVERLALVERALDGEVGALAGDERAGERGHDLEALGVHVHQRDRASAQARGREEAAEQQRDEHAAPAADDRDLDRHRDSCARRGRRTGGGTSSHICSLSAPTSVPTRRGPGRLCRRRSRASEQRPHDRAQRRA